MNKTFCNHCGREINVSEQDPFMLPPYEITDPDSEFYGTKIDVHLCGRCLDRLVDWMNKNYEYAPLVIMKNITEVL